MSSPVSIYIHVPFCLKKHNASTPDVSASPRDVRQRYLEALECEIQNAGELIDGREVAGLYVGGGGSLLRPDLLARLVLDIKRRMQPVRGMELTIRFAPETLISTTISGLNICSFNRISVEALAQRDKDFSFLETPFTYETIEDGLNMASLFKFPNCDIELLYGLPDQSAKAFENTLCAYANFHHVGHITLRPYLGAGRLSEEQRTERFEQAVDYLTRRGFALYGANRFARPGKECRFFLQECAGIDRIGFGAGAHTVLDGCWYHNTSDLGTYLEHAGDFGAIVAQAGVIDTAQDLYRQTALHLQTAQGCSYTPGAVPDLEQRLAQLAADGLVSLDGACVRPTHRGLQRPDLIRSALCA